MNSENIIKDKWLETVWEKTEKKMKAQSSRMGSIIPYVPENGRYVDMGERNITWWTNGFWSGILWQMYNATKDEEYRKLAEQQEERLDGALNKFMGTDHDAGFMWLHTAVANWRLTNNEESRLRGLQAATLLSGRYNPSGQFIRAWGGQHVNDERAGWMIIDCMMNLPLLYWASDLTKDPRYKTIAIKHAYTTMKHLLREDGSCYHIAAINPDTGELEYYPENQGYSPDSAWSRGQAWAIYGFALSYKYTGDKEFLDAAKKVAHYFIANVAMSGYVALVDFMAPEEPVMYDTTASTCAACGLLELADLVTEHEKRLYSEAAFKILHAVSEKHCNWNEEEDSIVQNGCVAYHRENEIDLPIIYGDYFFVEGILKLKGMSFPIW